MKIVEISNPTSNKYHSLNDFKSLTKKQKMAACSVAFCASVLPVLGTTAAFRSLVGKFKRKNDKIIFDKSMQKMRYNALKALFDHYDFYQHPEYITYKELKTFERQLQITTQIRKMRFYEYSPPKSRSFAKGCLFSQKIPEGIIAGYFDGEIGQRHRVFIKEEFPSIVRSNIKNHPLQIDKALKKAVDSSNDQCTAYTVIFIDKINQLVYTLNVGYGAANIYRRIENEWRSLPLTVPEDFRFKNNAIYQVIDLHAKVTVNSTGRGDMIVISSSGLKDFMNERDMIKVIADDSMDKAVALAHQAQLNGGENNDSVIVIRMD